MSEDGELRLEALQLSMNATMLDVNDEAIIKRAKKFFHFLKGNEGLLEDVMKND